MLFYTLLLSVVLLVLTDQAEAKTLIIRGSDADISQYPYMVSIRNNEKHFCGGSIYKPNVIISAAHCFLHTKTENLFISAGFTLLSEAQNVAKVKKVISHENYNVPVRHDNDIAILVLEKDLEFNSKVQPISLQTKREPDETPVTVIGWGHTRERGSNSDHLQQAEVEIIDQEGCQFVFYEYGRLNITDSMLCAAGNRGQDACQNDSGGPLIFDKKLIGVVSWGEGCASPFPGVYASIPDLHDWIMKNV